MRPTLKPLAALLVTLLSVGTHAAPPAAPTIDPERIRANIAEFASDEMNGRAFRSEEGKLAAQWVAERLAAAGAKPLEGRDSMLVPVGRMPAAAPNVVAWHPPKGAKAAGEYILVTAHFDHLPPAPSGDDRIYNGADDNASGVAGMIAVAEALRDDALDVGVVFVGFTGEEAGLVGSRAFLEEETLPPARIRGVFNMDMISRQPDGAIRLDGGPKGKVLVDLLVRLAPSVPIEMKVDTHPDWLPRSDQGAFLSAGIPAVLFSCEDHEDYHRVSDHADKTDAALAARVASLVALAVRTYAVEMAPRFDLSPVLGADGAPLRTIRVGRTMPNAPYWTPATRRSPDRGSDAALLDALAQQTGWRFEEKAVAFSSQVEALRTGEIDVVLNGATAELATLAPSGELVAVAPPYRSDSGVALLVKAGGTIDAKTDLATLRIEVRQGTGAAAYLAAHTAAKPVASNDPEGTIASRVSAGSIDAFAGDALSHEARAKRDPSFRVVRLASQPSCILCRAKDVALREALGAVIARLQAAENTPKK
ncbi:MAG: M20/M25/M40 family metallo-hydrolase [Planctomycetaceae bacterium]|nr:M20/M25/M40 family metallo-hydrolase [Planctomycetaceae bacterium]